MTDTPAPTDRKRQLTFAALLLVVVANLGIFGWLYVSKDSYLDTCRQQVDKMIAMMEQNLTSQRQQSEMIKRQNETAAQQAAMIQKLNAELAAAKAKPQ